MAKKSFTKKILVPGVYYPETPTGPKMVELSRARIGRIVANTQRLMGDGLRVPGPFRHDARAIPVRLSADLQDVDSYNNSGWWSDFWQDDDGALCGRLEVERPDAQERIGTSVTEVSPTIHALWRDGTSGKSYEDVLTHVALVTHPIATGQENFQPIEDREALVVSMSNMAFSERFAQALQVPVKPIPEHQPEPPKTVQKNISQATITDVIKALKAMQITLPDDTSPENFVERLLTAVLAIQGRADTGQGTTTTPPTGAKTEDAGAVAMSHTLTITNPFTKAPIELTFDTVEQFAAFVDNKGPEQYSHLAQENTALKASLQQTAFRSYVSRIESLIKAGRITKRYAEEQLRPFLKIEQFSLGGDGQFTQPALDAILTALETAPRLDLFQHADQTLAFGAPPQGAKVHDAPLFDVPETVSDSQQWTDEDDKTWKEVYAGHHGP